MPPTRRQLAKSRTRENLLAAARRVLLRRGLARTTTREIAEEAGVAIGTVFAHFRDVGALNEALLDELISHALTKAMATLPTGRGVVAELVHVAGSFYSAYAAEPDLSRAFLAGSLFATDPSGPTQQRLEEFRAWVGRRIELAVARKEVPPIDPRLAFAGFFSLYFGILIGGLRGEGDPPGQVMVLDSALRRFFGDTRAKPAGRPGRRAGRRAGKR